MSGLACAGCSGSGAGTFHPGDACHVCNGTGEVAGPPETNREPAPDSCYPHPRTNERDVMVVELDTFGRLSEREEVWFMSLLRKYPRHSVKITVEPRYPCGPPCDITDE